MNLKPHFSRFLGAEPDRLHFAAHTHHPWPDVSREAQLQAWHDAAEMMDDKWDHVFGAVIPERRTVAGAWVSPTRRPSPSPPTHTAFYSGCSRAWSHRCAC